MWVVDVFDKSSDRLIAQVELPRCKVSTVRRLFHLRPNDPVYGVMHESNELQVTELAKFARRHSDLSRLRRGDCFISYVLDPIRDRARFKDPKFRGDHPTPTYLPAFPGARRIRPGRSRSTSVRRFPPAP